MDRVRVVPPFVDQWRELVLQAVDPQQSLEMDRNRGDVATPIWLSHPIRMVRHMGENDVEYGLVGKRVIRLRELEQWLVYDGLPDGVPTRACNAQLVASIVEGAGSGGGTVVLVPPVETPIADVGGEGPDRACLLPRTAVRARFESTEPVSHAGDYSELTVVWLQEAWALPVDTGVADWLRRLDWDAHARDMVW